MIRPTFLAFETAKKALNVSQSGLDTVGHNISNANTPGYTRQRVDQVSLSQGGAAQRFQIFGMPTTGLGADVRAVSQIRDPYLDNRYRTEATNNGELGVKADGLTDINNIFDEIMTDGLHYKMGDLINAIDIFSLSADSKELAMVVRNKANELARMINKNATQLEEALTQQKADLKTTVNENVNNILEKIANLNTKIQEDNFYGNPSNELNDERNMLIDQLSEYVDIKVVRTPVKISNDLTIESLSIELKDSGDPAKNVPNALLVDNGNFNKFKVTEIEETNTLKGEYSGNVKITLVDSSSGFEIDIDGNRANGTDGDLTTRLMKGGLKGYIDIINGAGPGAPDGVSSFRGMPYYMASLDEFAQQLATVFNRINNISAQESIESGNPASFKETIDKNLFVPNVLNFTSSPQANWIDSISAGTRQFSGNDYGMTFSYNSATQKITAVANDGKTYTADYESGSQINFYGDDNTVAFSVKTTADAPVDGTVNIDANITAKNIALASSWLDDPMYLTTTKIDPVTKAKPELTLSGSNNPSWLKSAALVDGGISVPDGSYVFDYNATTKKISVTIGGDTYTADYEANATLELKNGLGTTGLTIVTNNKEITNTESKNTATLKTITGAAADNLNKLKVAIKDAEHYSVSGYYGNFQEFLSGSFQMEMSLDQGLNQSMLDTSTVVIGGYADRRDAVSAVSIDEEGINMMTYQNYYNAAARYMTALDEALDKIINGMGTVGR